jgi:arylsulfatase A-like enzyme
MNLPSFLFLILIISTINLEAQSEPTPPNIVCILVDDLGYGDLSRQGATDLKTPHIDRIGEQGMTFTNFYANCTVCSPSRASLLTGKYPDLVGIPGVVRQNEENNWGYLSKDAILLPQVLNAAGYHTAIIGKWHLGYEKPNTPNDRGFDHFHGFLGDMMDDYWTHLRGGKNWMRLNDQVIDPEGHATDLFTKWSIDYLQERKANQKPFFLYLAYNAPHFPIQPPDDFLEVVREREPQLSEKRAKNVAFIEHLDACIGKVMQSLKETGLIENTIVVFTSDNGGALRYEQSNGHLRGGKQDMYEGGIKVPTYVQWKNRIEPGSKTSNFSIHMDLFNTFCDIAGIDIYHEVDGISILPTLLGSDQETGDRTIFWVRREGGHYGGKAYYAARRGPFKILQNTPYEPLQFFRLDEDPLESNALSPEAHDTFKDLQMELKEHIRKSGRIPWQSSN